ncbi:MAG: magnesium protoporphyrin IX methyltransferase [Hyphomicrobiales bacterium]|jgi:magnesium-protoporphyrin O-methyltransferase
MQESAHPIDTYQTRRGEIEAYFDRTAAKTWERLTSDAPVSGIRATVRAGRDAMRTTLLSWLPDDMTGQRLLDAGCGTGALAVEAAKRGADVVAVDLSPNLVNVARERMPLNLPGAISWHAGDMLDDSFGLFDHVVAMDSVIHYEAGDKVGALARLAARADGQVLFTFAPKTPLLAAMHTVGKAFPRGDRSPAIVPISEKKLRRLMRDRMPDFAAGNTKRIASGFYTSQAFQITRREPRR